MMPIMTMMPFDREGEGDAGFARSRMDGRQFREGETVKRRIGRARLGLSLFLIPLRPLRAFLRACQPATLRQRPPILADDDASGGRWKRIFSKAFPKGAGKMLLSPFYQTFFDFHPGVPTSERLFLTLMAFRQFLFPSREDCEELSSRRSVSRDIPVGKDSSIVSKARKYDNADCP